MKGTFYILFGSLFAFGVSIEAEDLAERKPRVAIIWNNSTTNYPIQHVTKPSPGTNYCIRYVTLPADPKTNYTLRTVGKL